MTLTVNGQPQECTSAQTVRDLVIQLGLGEAAVAVELNRQVVPRRLHEATLLHNGDCLEIVTLVGGG